MLNLLVQQGKQQRKLEHRNVKVNVNDVIFCGDFVLQTCDFPGASSIEKFIHV